MFFTSWLEDDCVEAMQVHVYIYLKNHILPKRQKNYKILSGITKKVLTN